MTVTRRCFVATALSGIAATAMAARPQAAETFDVEHTEEEWRKLLTPDQFAVLR
jgi:peptide-methionine (R)-S-oxide reductase